MVKTKIRLKLACLYANLSPNLRQENNLNANKKTK